MQAMSTDNTSGEHRWNAPLVAPRVALPAQGQAPHSGLERAMPIARPLTIKAPISEATAAARAP